MSGVCVAVDRDPNGWWNTAWSSRRRLVFNNLAGQEDLLDFPVLVVLDRDPERINYNVSQSLGEDLRFIDKDGVELEHEIESWDTGGKSFVWVRVPQLDGRSTTDLMWMYYGNAQAVSAEDAESVWNSNHAAVWHLSDDPIATAPQMKDSSKNGNHGTVHKSQGTGFSVAMGQIGRALDFDGAGDHIEIPRNVSLDFSGRPDLTLEAWIRTEPFTHQFNGVLGNSSGGGTGTRLSFLVLDSGFIRFSMGDCPGGALFQSTSSVIATRTWYYTAITVLGSGDVTLYVDGAAILSCPLLSDLELSDQPWVVGSFSKSNASSWAWGGQIDEVRVSAVARTAAWIETQNRSMRDQLIVYGAEETQE